LRLTPLLVLPHPRVIDQMPLLKNPSRFI